MERETDHGSIAWGNNLMQFKQSRQFECLVKSLFAPVNVLHTAFYDLLHKRGVDTAQGAQLDGVGRIVGLPRTVSNAASIPFFGFDGQENIRGFGQARMRRENDTLVGGFTRLPDEDYRGLLKWKIAVNNGHGTVPEIVSAMGNVFGAELAMIRDWGNANFQVAFNAENAPEHIVNNRYRLIPKAAGVGLEVVIVKHKTPFGFADQNYYGFGQGVMLSNADIVI